jgi:hypothetical protein
VWVKADFKEETPWPPKASFTGLGQMLSDAMSMIFLVCRSSSNLIKYSVSGSTLDSSSSKK